MASLKAALFVTNVFKTIFNLFLVQKNALVAQADREPQAEARFALVKLEIIPISTIVRIATQIAIFSVMKCAMTNAPLL